MYIDGTKPEANANKYAWVWKKATERSRYRLYAKITALPDEMNGTLSWIGLRMETNEEYVPEYPEELLTAYREIYKPDTEAFVHGKGRHKTEQQRQYERLREYKRKLAERQPTRTP